MGESIEKRFRAVAPAVDFWSLRFVEDRNEEISVRRGVVLPPHTSFDAGVMVTVVDGGGTGYAATCDLTDSGLRRAAEQALAWAKRTEARTLIGSAAVPPHAPRGEFETPVRVPWEATPLRDKIDLLREQSDRLHADERIVDWGASLWYTEYDSAYFTSTGGEVRQCFRYLVPSLSATANQGSETQTRSFGGDAFARQGGLEVLDDVAFRDAAPRIAAEAIELLMARNCPEGAMDLVLAPDQMILQIHESIGHPLELDRILGDERNYAGTSFVTVDMFGSYRYGSDLLNITFDPERPEQFASYAFDDEGQPARKEYLIRSGILVRPLGSRTSQLRAGMDGVANARANSWNRPPIDRMANLNLEPGTARFDDLITAVERGVYMETNCSWSIDDSRNKFQFGCEWGRLIEGGRLGAVVKKPNYRGISATFWRSLAMVGDAQTFAVMGTPFCGKGEPNQVIRVGHASPACLFRSVEVFGGA